MGVFDFISDVASGLTGGDILSTGLQVVGAFQSSKAQKQQVEDRTAAAVQQREQQRAIALRNAELAKEQAAEISSMGRAAERDLRLNVLRNVGTVRAQTAGAGLLVDDGPGTTPRTLVADMIEAGEMDILRTRRDVEYQRRQAVRQAESDTLNAGFLTENIEQTRAAGARTAGSINPFFDAFTAGATSLARNNRFNDLLLDRTERRT